VLTESGYWDVPGVVVDPFRLRVADTVSPAVSKANNVPILVGGMVVVSRRAPDDRSAQERGVVAVFRSARPPSTARAPKPCLSRSRAHDPHPHHCRPRRAHICRGLGSCSTGTVHEGRGIVQSTCCARCDHVWSRTSGDLQSEFYTASTSAKANLC
jgi:hypothetical protein